jgi:hypothetical protein
LIKHRLSRRVPDNASEIFTITSVVETWTPLRYPLIPSCAIFSNSRPATTDRHPHHRSLPIQMVGNAHPWLSRGLEPVVGDPSAPGSHRCRGRYRDRDRFRLILWLVLTHGQPRYPSFVSIATMRSSKALRVAFPAPGFSCPNPIFCPSIPIPIPTPTPIIIPTVIGTRLSCIENMSKLQGGGSRTAPLVSNGTTAFHFCAARI